MQAIIAKPYSLLRKFRQKLYWVTYSETFQGPDSYEESNRREKALFRYTSIERPWLKHAVETYCLLSDADMEVLEFDAGSTRTRPKYRLAELGGGSSERRRASAAQAEYSPLVCSNCLNRDRIS